jgi:hypothetical protein
MHIGEEPGLTGTPPVARAMSAHQRLVVRIIVVIKGLP